MAKPVQALMAKEMTRKEFVATMGFGVVSLLGFSNVIHMLTGKSMLPSHLKTRTSGYGGSAYGGGKD